MIDNLVLYEPVKKSARGNLCANCSRPRYGSAPSPLALFLHEPRYCKSCYVLRSQLRKRHGVREVRNLMRQYVSIARENGITTHIFEHFDDPARQVRREEKTRSRAMAKQQRELSRQRHWHYPYNQRDPLLDRALKLTPDHLPSDIKEDVCQQIAIDLLEGKQPNVRQLVRHIFSESSYGKRFISLDQPLEYMKDGSAKTLHDVLAIP